MTLPTSQKPVFLLYLCLTAALACSKSGSGNHSTTPPTDKSYTEYKLVITVGETDSTVSGFYGEPSYTGLPIYHDEASFKVDLKVTDYGSTDSIYDIVNQAPTVKPSAASDPLNDWTWLPDAYGLTNITDISATQVTRLLSDSIIRFYIHHTGTAEPGFTVAYGLPGYKTTRTAQPEYFGGVIGFPETLDVDLRHLPYSTNEGALGKVDIAKVEIAQ